MIWGGGWWMWAMVSPDGVAPSQMVGVSASLNLPLHHKVQKFSSGTGSPGWSRQKGCKVVVVWCGGAKFHACKHANVHKHTLFLPIQPTVPELPTKLNGQFVQELKTLLSVCMYSSEAPSRTFLGDRL